MDRRSVVRQIWITAAVIIAAVMLLGDRGFALAAIGQVIAVAIAAQGFNLLLGITGQISIGHAAFVAVGAYTSAILATRAGIPFPVTLLPIILIAALLGLLIGLPALRLKGYYLAIATIAFGVVIQQIIAGSDALGGFNGIRNIPGFIGGDIGTLVITGTFYLLLSLLSGAIIASPLGQRFRMVRDSELAARSYGIELARTKLLAFVLSAIYGGIAGALYAHTVGFIVPAGFGLVLSLNILAIVIIGGLASVHGPLIGSAIIVGLPFIFSRSFGGFLNIVVGALLIVFVLFFPRGLAYGLTLANHRYFQRPAIAIRKAIRRRQVMNGKRTTIDGVEIFYREGGSADAAPLLYLHGNTGSSLWYERVMDIPGIRTIAPDMPNFGHSGHIPEADIDRYADYVAGFIREMNLAPVPLVAHSLGGAVAHSLVSRNPELISRLLLVDASAPDGLVTPEEHYEAIELYKTSRELLRRGLAAVTPAMKDERFLDQLTDEALLMNPIAFAGNARALARINYTDALGGFSGPVLVLLGTRDTIITRDMAERTAAAYARAELRILDGIGHSVMVEDPEGFRQIVKEWAGA